MYNETITIFFMVYYWALDDWTDGIPIGGRNISNLRYADDIALVATRLQHIKELLSHIEQVILEFGLKINR